MWFYSSSLNLHSLIPEYSVSYLNKLSLSVKQKYLLSEVHPCLALQLKTSYSDKYYSFLDHWPVSKNNQHNLEYEFQYYYDKFGNMFCLLFYSGFASSIGHYYVHQKTIVENWRFSISSQWQINWLLHLQSQDKL